MGFRLVGVAAVCALFGCSLATDLSGLAGDAGAGDAPNQADAGDAADGADATADAGGDGCAPFVCPLNAQCASFDTGLVQPFHDTSQGSGSTQVVQTEFVSCPDALESDLAPSTNGIPSATVSDSMTVTSLSSADVVLELDVWLPLQPPSPISAFVLHASPSSVSLKYALSTWSLFVEAANQTVAVAPRLGAWNHMKLEVLFSNDANTGRATLTYVGVDGQPANATIQDKTYAAVQPIASLVADVGLAGQVTSETTAYYDNVVFRLP